MSFDLAIVSSDKTFAEEIIFMLYSKPVFLQPAS